MKFKQNLRYVISILSLKVTDQLSNDVKHLEYPINIPSFGCDVNSSVQKPCVNVKSIVVFFIL